MGPAQRLKRGGVILFDCISKRGGVIEATYFRTRKFELRSYKRNHMGLKQSFWGGKN